VTSLPDREVWDAELRPHRTPLFAYVAAILIAGVLVTVGFLLKVKSTGVVFQTADQVAMAVLGLVLGGAVLLFTRPRLRVGPAGLSVRNLLGDRTLQWSDIVGVSFPPGSRMARVDLPDDEYIPVMAIQSVDKERAVAAMDTVRSLLVRYRPDLRTG
jgi:Bacterial PH domain